MAKGYIVEEVRLTGGTMRLRDSLTGEMIDVAITPGAAFNAPKPAERRDNAAAAPTKKADDGGDAKKTRDEQPVANEDKTGAHTDKRKGPRASKTASKRPRAKKAESPFSSTEGKGASEPNPLETHEGRTVVVDESTLTTDDKAAIKTFRSMLGSMSRRGKRGELGWQETTVDGRSGLLARWGKGQFKLIHAGGDTYALFYEWDGGKWERIACGGAEDLMHLATKRAEEEIPRPPLSTLNLELARLFCGTPEQKEAARERLEPVFQEVDTRRRRPRSRPSEETADATPDEAVPAETDGDAEENPEMDEKITGSLKKVLEDLD